MDDPTAAKVNDVTAILPLNLASLTKL